MCYVCSCFGSCLDIFQRLITFVLACFACWAISCGLLVAIIVGVAYGYNYSLAEFLSLSRSDVTVYMKRGQFYEMPDLERRIQSSGVSNRRSNDDDKFSHPNLATDYRDQNAGTGRRSGDDQDTRPLEEVWAKSRDDNSYAEKLDKFGPAPMDVRKMEIESSHKEITVNPDTTNNETETPTFEGIKNPKNKIELHERTLEVQPIEKKETIYANDEDNLEKAKIKSSSDPLFEDHEDEKAKVINQDPNVIYLDTTNRQVPNRKRPVVNPTSIRSRIIGRKPAQARVDTNLINQDPNIVYVNTVNREGPTKIPAVNPTFRSRIMDKKPAQAKVDTILKNQDPNILYFDTENRQVPTRIPAVNPTLRSRIMDKETAQAKVDTNLINQDPNIVYYDTENRQVPTIIPAGNPTRMHSRNMGRKPAQAKVDTTLINQDPNIIYYDTENRQVPTRIPAVNPTFRSGIMDKKLAEAKVDTNQINQDPNIVYFDTENRQVPTRVPAGKPTRMRSRNMGRKPAQAKVDELDMSKIEELKSRFLHPDMKIRFEDSSLKPKRRHKDWDAVNKKNEDLDDERTTIKSSSKHPPPEDRDDFPEADSEEIDGDEGVFYKSV